MDFLSDLERMNFHATSIAVKVIEALWRTAGRIHVPLAQR
jgi:hypothetical protein